MSKQDRWAEKNRQHEEPRPRTQAELRRDVEALIQSDLEARVRNAEVWGLKHARRVVEAAALEWARKEVG